MIVYSLYTRYASMDAYTKIDFSSFDELINEAKYRADNNWEVVINPKGNLFN